VSFASVRPVRLAAPHTSVGAAGVEPDPRTIIVEGRRLVRRPARHALQAFGAVCRRRIAALEGRIGDIHRPDVRLGQPGARSLARGRTSLRWIRRSIGLARTAIDSQPLVGTASLRPSSFDPTRSVGPGRSLGRRGLRRRHVRRDGTAGPRLVSYRASVPGV
jgi:hypothetical protein